MEDCKYLKTEDITGWHCDVYDHPNYKYICEKIGKEIIPFMHCKRCKENTVGKNETQDAVYKDGIFICPNCGKSTFPLALYDGDYCIKCGQYIRWRGIVKKEKSL